MNTMYNSPVGRLELDSEEWSEAIPRECGVWRRTLHLIARQLPARVFEERSKTGGSHLLFARYFVATIPDWKLFGRLAGGRVYLHHYLQPDLIDALHNHPWDLGVALPLAGGYLERRLIRYDDSEGKWRIIEQVYDRKAFRPYRLTGADFHTITKLHCWSSWSLFFHGPFTKAWGFVSEANDGTVQFREFPGQNKPEAKGNWWTSARRGSFYNAK